MVEWLKLHDVESQERRKKFSPSAAWSFLTAADDDLLPKANSSNEPKPHDRHFFYIRIISHKGMIKTLSVSAI